MFKELFRKINNIKINSKKKNFRITIIGYEC